MEELLIPLPPTLSLSLQKKKLALEKLSAAAPICRHPIMRTAVCYTFPLHWHLNSPAGRNAILQALDPWISSSQRLPQACSTPQHLYVAGGRRQHLIQ